MQRASKFQLLGVLALALVLVMAAPVLANDMKGTILSIDPDNHVFDLVNDDGNVSNFQVALVHQVFIDDVEQTLSDLTPGDQVTVTYEIQNEVLMATLIRCTRD